jgi:hypothetical protein
MEVVEDFSARKIAVKCEVSRNPTLQCIINQRDTQLLMVLKLRRETTVPHVQGVESNYAIFASEEMMISRWGVHDGQKCPFKDSNVATIMLTTPCKVSGAYPSLTHFATILLPLVSHPCRWAGISHSSQENIPCSLGPLERWLSHFLNRRHLIG